MINKISFILCVFFSIICFSQEFDSTSKIVLNQLVEEHEFFKKELVKSRGAVYNFEADEVFFENMFKSNNKLGIIVYTYINDSLKLSLFLRRSPTAATKFSQVPTLQAVTRPGSTNAMFFVACDRMYMHSFEDGSQE